MAKISLSSNPALVTVNDTNDNEILFTDGFTADMHGGRQILMIEVTVGAVRFGVGKAADPTSRAYAVGEKVVIPHDNGKKNVWFKLGTANDAFSVSAI